MMAMEQVRRRERRSSSQNFSAFSAGIRPLMCTCNHTSRVVKALQT